MCIYPLFIIFFFVGKKAALIIMTDGEASDGDIVGEGVKDMRAISLSFLLNNLLLLSDVMHRPLSLLLLRSEFVAQIFLIVNTRLFSTYLFSL